MKILVALLVVATVAGGFVLRTVPMWDAVLSHDPPRLIGTDPWHHLRQAELLVAHFPRRAAVDPCALWPDGMASPVGPLLPYLTASAALVAGGGAPSARTVAVTAALLPPLFGALTILVAFLLGRRFAGTGAGLVAGLVAAVVPGQFLQRTVVGYADHHALEALLSALAVLALARAAARPARLSGVPAGAVLGLYLLAWPGGALLVLALALFALLQVHADCLLGRDPAPGARVLLSCFATAALVALPARGGAPGAEFQTFALAGAVAAVVVPWALARRTGRFLPLATAGAGVAALLAGWLVAPATVRGLLDALAWFRAGGVQETVAEAAPLLSPEGSFSLSLAWQHFGPALPLAIAGLLATGGRFARDAKPPDGLLLAWSLVMLFATLGQNRFGYYFTVNAGVLAGAFLAPWLTRLWRREGPRPAPAWIGRGLWPAAAAILLAVPTGPLALESSRRHPGPRDAWVSALDWLRENTPDPFGGAAARPGYSVLSWWDAGYWITSIGRRVPVANPTQAGACEAAAILTAPDGGTALALCRRHGVRYVVLDGDVPMLPVRRGEVTGQLGEIARWAGDPPDRYFETYWRAGPNGGREPVLLFYPEYFRTLAVRLFVFAGREWEPDGVLVVAWREVDGEKEIVALETFADYPAATARAKELGPNARVAGADPLRSCVPLEALPAFRPVHVSTEVAAHRFLTPIPDLQVYEVASGE